MEPASSPARVPSRLVVDYDYISGDGIKRFPPTALEQHRDPDKALLYSNCNGGFWIVTQYDLARQVLRDPETFAQWPGGGLTVPFPKPRIPQSFNPPELLAWRKVLLPLFSLGRIKKLEPVYREIARSRLETIKRQGRCEFFEEYAMALPVARFCRELALPAANATRFVEYSYELVFGTARVRESNGTAEAQAHRDRYADAIEGVLLEAIQMRRKEPGEDLISLLLQAEKDGLPLSDDELLSILGFFFYAGTDTTAVAIAMAMVYLAQNPFFREQIMVNGQLAAEGVDELLRVGALHHLSRLVTRDVDLGGTPLKAGDRLIVSTAAANRDPAEFDRPDELVPDRNPNPHLTFGSGPHRCMGAQQATLEVKIALEEWHQCIPRYQLAPGFRPTFLSAGAKSHPASLELTFEPA